MEGNISCKYTVLPSTVRSTKAATRVPWRDSSTAEFDRLSGRFSWAPYPFRSKLVDEALDSRLARFVSQDRIVACDKLFSEANPSRSSKRPDPLVPEGSNGAFSCSTAEISKAPSVAISSLTLLSQERSKSCAIAANSAGSSGGQYRSSSRCG